MNCTLVIGKVERVNGLGVERLNEFLYQTTKSPLPMTND